LLKTNFRTLLILPLIILGSLLVVPSLPSAHAATGIVCLAPNGSTTCPTPPVSIAGNVGSTVRIAVVVQGSDNLNGFDITVLADHTILKPVSVDLTGSILTSPISVVVECLQGVLIAGSTCLSTDTIDTAHFAAVGGSLVSGNGLLFTVVYQVLQGTQSTPVDFQTGCPTPSGTCARITNGTITPPTETTQAATFSTPDFVLSASPTTVTITPGATGASTISASSTGGYADLVNIAVSGSTLPTAPTLSKAQLDLVSFSSDSATLNVGPATTGTYVVNVTATGSGSFSTIIPTHTVTVTVVVHPPDFSVSASPSTVSIPPGSSGSTTISVGSLGGFTGTVMLSASTPAGITASPSSNSVTAPAVFSLSISVASSVAPGNYKVNETGTATTGTHTATITVMVGAGGFTLGVVPDSVSVPRGQSASAVITVQSTNNFAGTVSLTVSIMNTTIPDSAGSTSLTSTLNPASVSLTAGGSAPSTLIVLTLPSTATAFYKATITGTSGALTSSTVLNFNVFDFSLAEQFTTMTLGTGSNFNTVKETLSPILNGTDGCPAIGPPCDITTFVGASITNTIFITSLGGMETDAVAGLPSSLTGARGSLFPEVGLAICQLKVFDSNGNVIPLSTLKHQGPIADGGAITGCRFDSTTFVEPGLARCLNDGGCTLLPEMYIVGQNSTFFSPDLGAPFPLTETPAGTYTIQMCIGSGSLVHCITWQLIVTTIPASVQVNQLTYSHSVKLVNGAGSDTFKVGLTNPVANPNLWVQIQVTLTDSTGTITVTGTSAIFQLPANGAQFNNNLIPISFDSTTTGTFHFALTVIVGVSANSVTQPTTPAAIGSGNLHPGGTVTVS